MTYAQRTLPEALHADVERALAFGRSDEWITAHIGVCLADIDSVRDYMDAVINEPDGAHYGHVRTGGDA